MFSTLILVLSLFLSLVIATSKFTPARPPSLPLAVKSPYLSTWLNGGAAGTLGGYLPGQWPAFWNGQTTGWTGIIRVDGVAYTWMGNPLNMPSLADQTSAEYTSTKSIFTLDIGGNVSMTVTFLSPVTPNDQKRQSLIFSYMDVQVVSTDGNSHDVQLYTDISAEFVSGDRTDIVQWDEVGTVDNVTFHKLYKQDPMIFSEKSDQSEWGNWYYATDAVAGLTYATGIDDDIRGEFRDQGKLPNSNDSDYRAINSQWPVFAFSIDLGSVGTTTVFTLFSLGLCQDTAVQFLGKNGLQPLPSLWTDYFGSDLEALSFFHHDFSDSMTLAANVDMTIEQNSLAAAGQDYLTITSLAARQAFGALNLVGTQDEPYLFLKEISSDGNIQTVDVMFPTHPILLYTNPNLIKLLLNPLFENQESGHYPNNYSMHDLGSNYPNATGHPTGNDEAMPLEECGNMLIMVLAYYKHSGDVQYLNDHYPILNQWTQYLIGEALYPEEQLSTDDFAGTLVNQTNLALKGMIGIEAMSVIANLTNHTAEAANYTAIAHSYITQWQTLGIDDSGSYPHSTLNYNNVSSWGILYNLYADRLLNLSLVPDAVYAHQSAYYPTVAHTYGIPLDTRHTYTKTDWEMWAAAIASNETRDMFHSRIAKWINETEVNRPFSDLYWTDDGEMVDSAYFQARPVVGGAFALLALAAP